LGRGGCPPNTMWPGPRPTFMPSGILIHPAVWPQQTLAEKVDGGLLRVPVEGGAESPSNTVWPGPRSYTSIPSGILIYPAVGHHGPKSGGLMCPLFGEGELGHHLTQCRLGRSLPLYRVASSSIQLFGNNRHGPKIGGLCPFGERGAGFTT